MIPCSTTLSCQSKILEFKKERYQFNEFPARDPTGAGDCCEIFGISLISCSVPDPAFLIPEYEIRTQPGKGF